MIDPDAQPIITTESQFPETKSPEMAVRESNRDVIEAIYRAAGQVVPDPVGKHIDHSGVLRLVYDRERQEAEANAEGKTTHPAIDVLSELLVSGKILHTNIPGAIRGFKPKDDPLYKILDKAWGPVYEFTDAATSEVLCYSMKADTYQDAPTVLVSPEHIDLEMIERLNR
jgi:hypothetical protein